MFSNYLKHVLSFWHHFFSSLIFWSKWKLGLQHVLIQLNQSINVIVVVVVFLTLVVYMHNERRNVFLNTTSKCYVATSNNRSYRMYSKLYFVSFPISGNSLMLHLLLIFAYFPQLICNLLISFIRKELSRIQKEGCKHYPLVCVINAFTMQLFNFCYYSV